MTKKCNRCGRRRNAGEFYARYAKCKACMRNERNTPEAKLRTSERNKANWIVYYAKPSSRMHKSAYNANYRVKHRTKLNEQAKQYYAENVAGVVASAVKYKRVRRRQDPLYNFTHVARGVVRGSFNRAGIKKTSKTFSVIGLPPEEFRRYIESCFLPGMTLANHGFGSGKWHIDHIVPLATAKTEGDVIRLCHYTNLRPLWHDDNLRKGARG